MMDYWQRARDPFASRGTAAMARRDALAALGRWLACRIACVYDVQCESWCQFFASEPSSRSEAGAGVSPDKEASQSVYNGVVTRAT